MTVAAQKVARGCRWSPLVSLWWPSSSPNTELEKFREVPPRSEVLNEGSFTTQSSMVCRRERRVDCRGGWSMWGLVIYRAPSPLNGVSRVWGVTRLVLANHILVSSATLARSAASLGSRSMQVLVIPAE